MRTLEQIAAKWPNEAANLAKVIGARRSAFEAWMVELEKEYERRGSPAGPQLSAQTGLVCWLEFFDDGYTPAEALDEDWSND